MSDSIQDILSLQHYSVSSLEVIASHPDVFKPEDDSVFTDEFFFIHRYHDGCREISVYARNLGDGATSVEFVEKEETLLLKRGARLMALGVMCNGKNVASINWKDLMMFTRERMAMVYVQSAQDIDEFAAVASEAAELLQQQYETVYKERMRYAPLKDMILTEMIR
ncbi:hypothetical protein HYV85_00665 [Candidatus Woesearchaeota archaeon]|nr:hypothetical protein [Candidatus Woesearchaeota archaeon]